MRRLLPLLPLLAVAATPSPAPKRIVSLHLCADQYLLALADRSQVAGLTRYARDPAMSPQAAQARSWPVTGTSAEEVLALDPDLAIVSPGRTFLNRPRAVLELADTHDYPGIVAQTRLVARAIGHPERGEALIRRMNAALARVPRDAGRQRVAAEYQRRGFLTGTGTLIDDLMRRVGLVNLAARLGRSPLAQVPIEAIVAARPDFLLVEEGDTAVVDQGTAMRAHPALAHIPRLVLPRASTTCGGPAYVLAAASLARQLRQNRALTPP
ncbi:ABC transporter substrate-binding protein [Sphingomonas sp.]|uniref:ABC transporter substrate-binding protein n=1 Tax=Sphingomonas sp. TaxID=28214 RepID=UPI0035BBB034